MFFVGPAKDLKGRLAIHADEQLRRWKKGFTMVLNNVTSDEVPPVLDEMANYQNLRMWTARSSRSEIILAIDTLKRLHAGYTR